MGLAWSWPWPFLNIVDLLRAPILTASLRLLPFFLSFFRPFCLFIWFAAAVFCFCFAYSACLPFFPASSLRFPFFGHINSCRLSFLWLSPIVITKTTTNIRHGKPIRRCDSPVQPCAIHQALLRHPSLLNIPATLHGKNVEHTETQQKYSSIKNIDTVFEGSNRTANAEAHKKFKRNKPERARQPQLTLKQQRVLAISALGWSMPCTNGLSCACPTCIWCCINLLHANACVVFLFRSFAFAFASAVPEVTSFDFFLSPFPQNSRKACSKLQTVFVAHNALRNFFSIRTIQKRRATAKSKRKERNLQKNMVLHRLDRSHNGAKKSPCKTQLQPMVLVPVPSRRKVVSFLFSVAGGWENPYDELY